MVRNKISTIRKTPWEHDSLRLYTDMPKTPSHSPISPSEGNDMLKGLTSEHPSATPLRPQSRKPSVMFSYRDRDTLERWNELLWIAQKWEYKRSYTPDSVSGEAVFHRGHTWLLTRSRSGSGSRSRSRTTSINHGRDLGPMPQAGRTLLPARHTKEEGGSL